MPLRREFADRTELATYCRQLFPHAPGAAAPPSPIRGGRRAAEQRLAAVDPAAYERTRNFLDGAVTRLSPYLRHGVLGLAETVRCVKSSLAKPEQGAKLLQELAWRDYWRRVLEQIGDEVWADREPYKTGLSAEDYAHELPEDFVTAQTGVDFIDAMVRELYDTGYLHNQARMKLAAYVVHWRRVRWQAGAAWMLSYLLDGDLASNNLSWQWVASTFAAKPYLFNQENLQFVSRGRFAGVTPDGSSPFAGDYDELARRLFA